MRKIFLLTSLLIIITTLASCDLFTSPEELESGRRDYVWEEDTIKVPEGYYTNLSRIWGSDPNDVWICGVSYISDHTIWHYDGEEWCNLNINRFITPYCVYGFSHNNIWFGTLEKNIWHWNGNELELYGTYDLPNYNNVSIQNMWGLNRTNVYAVGFAENYQNSEIVGIILKFDGSDWRFINIYEESLTFIDIRQQKSSGYYFLNSYVHHNAQAPYKLFTMINNSLETIYEGSKYISLQGINGEVYFVRDKRIYKHRNNNLIEWKDFSNTTFKGRMWGRSEVDFFTTNTSGIGHYNGNNLITIYETNYRIENIQLFEKDIFALCKDRVSNKNVIIRGRLN